MKYTLKAVLMSAFIMPGVGQVVCGQLLRGLALMAVTTVVFLGLLVKVALMFSKAVNAFKVAGGAGAKGDWLPFVASYMQRQADFLFLVMLGLFVAVWVYGVLDAFRLGRAADRSTAAPGEVEGPGK